MPPKDWADLGKLGSTLYILRAKQKNKTDAYRGEEDLLFYLSRNLDVSHAGLRYSSDHGWSKGNKACHTF